MKKILSFMTSLAIGATATSVVTSCGVNESNFLGAGIHISDANVDVLETEKDKIDKIWDQILDKNPDLKKNRSAFEEPDINDQEHWQEKFLVVQQGNKTSFVVRGKKASPYYGWIYFFPINYITNDKTSN